MKKILITLSVGAAAFAAFAVAAGTSNTRLKVARCNFVVYHKDTLITKNACSIEAAFNTLPIETLVTCKEKEAQYLIDRAGWMDAGYPGLYLKEK